MTERGWPSFMDGIDKRRWNAGEGSGKESFDGRTDARTGPVGNSDGLRSSARSAGPPEDGDISHMPHRATDSAWAIAGGTAVFLGSLLPFVYFSDPEIGVNPGARSTSALFGLIVLGLGIALRAVPRRYLMGTSLATLCLSALGALGYAITIVAGLAGTTEQDVTFYPGIGIILALAGCVAAGVAGISSIQHYRS